MLTVNGRELRVQNKHIIAELRALNSSKAWIKSLNYPIEDTLKINEHVLVSYIANLLHNTRLQMDWCFPQRSELFLTLMNMKRWAPCGYVHIDRGIKSAFRSWDAYTNAAFVIQLHFINFQTDISRNMCRHSTVLRIAEYSVLKKQWVYINRYGFCGIRKSWISTLSTNFGGVSVEEANVRRPCNITFLYTSLDKENAYVFKKHMTIHRMRITHESFTLSYKSEHFSKIYRWLISVRIGYKLLFTQMKLCCFSGKLEIFEDEEMIHMLIQRMSTKDVEYVENLHLTSRYFVSLVYFQATETYHNVMYNKLVMMMFERIRAKSILIGKNSSTTVSNLDTILYVSYKLPRDNNFFPNISFTIRKFSGLNGENCHYGGFFIGNHFVTGTINVLYEQGPFCDNSYDTQPMVGVNGPKFIVLGRFQYYIIVYAYGPYYNIDFDIHVKGSKCEGLFEPTHMCSGPAAGPYEENMKVTEQSSFRRFVKGANFNVICYLKHTYVLVFTLRIFNISRCILIQTVSHNDNVTEAYLISAPMNVHARFLKSFLYKTSFKHFGTSVAMLRFKMRNLTSTKFDLNATTDLFKKDVSGVNVYLWNKIQHQGITLSLHIEAIDSVSECAINRYNNTNLHYIGTTLAKDVHYNLDITNACGSLIYVDKLIYTFKFDTDVTRLTHVESVFANILIISNLTCVWNCTESCTDSLTFIASSATISHSVKVINPDIYLELRELMYGLIYEKRCNRIMEFHYSIGRVKVLSKFYNLQKSLFIVVRNVWNKSLYAKSIKLKSKKSYV